MTYLYSNHYSDLSVGIIDRSDKQKTVKVTVRLPGDIKLTRKISIPPNYHHLVTITIN